jgi:hypothetical protein
MKNIFEGIAYLCEEVLFTPFNALRAMELENWAAANVINWLLIIIGATAIVYWVLQLRKADKNDNERKDISSHSYI